MIYIVATPIGNLEDITLRALRVLKEVDYILCEDTRRTGILLKHHGIRKKMVSFNDHNRDRRLSLVLKDLEKGVDIALVSDAGTPIISDPGYKLIKECIKRGIEVTSVPGASSVINAIVLSGLPPDKFYFAGFLPRKKGKRKKELEFIKELPCTTILFESPERIENLMEELEVLIPDREVVILREMTKIYEERIAGRPSELKGIKKPRGEIVVLIQGKS